MSLSRMSARANLSRTVSFICNGHLSSGNMRLGSNRRRLSPPCTCWAVLGEGFESVQACVQASALRTAQYVEVVGVVEAPSIVVAETLWGRPLRMMGEKKRETKVIEVK